MYHTKSQTEWTTDTTTLAVTEPPVPTDTATPPPTGTSVPSETPTATPTVMAETVATPIRTPQARLTVTQPAMRKAIQATQAMQMAL